jgi:hypothetical protein
MSFFSKLREQHDKRLAAATSATEKAGSVAKVATVAVANDPRDSRKRLAWISFVRKQTMTDEERKHWEQAEQLAYNLLAQCDDHQIAISAAAMTIMCRDFCASIGLEKDHFIACLDKAWIEETVH